MADLATARDLLENQIRAAAGDAFANARVVAYTDAGSQHLIVLSGLPGIDVSFSQEGTDTIIDNLRLDAGNATNITAFVSDDIAPISTVAIGATVDVSIGGIGPHTATTTAVANDLNAIATQLQTAIRNADPGSSSAFTGARVASYEAGENRLLIIPGDTSDTITFTAGTVDNTTVTQLLLGATNAQVNVQSYKLQGGEDGNPADGNALMGGGDPNAKAGIYALEDVDLFNILCIPRAAVLAGDSATETEGVAVMTVANNYCQQRRAFFIMDTPPNIDAPPNIDEVEEISNWLDRNATLRSKNAALYFPRVHIPDPLNNFKLRSIGASGTIAGLFARTDSTRGVWKAPAGTDATLRNVAKLEVTLTDQQNGVLNPLGINCLRTFPVYGSICWGARTLNGADQQTSEWKYIPVVRVALFIEETLYRGLKWVVFEPNDEPLWSQIRLNVGAFMQNLFRQGAFQGKSPREAYLVKCDRETTTQNDINLGIVNIVVGFAPLKPAEFVIIKLQQLAGQIQV
ncbi:MAG TPA: phage tail sheath family protein [Trichormus sp. M33_DOE_039]|nr:phage tail sheath family protein [Trichormus sp. M33_DOE_039]